MIRIEFITLLLLASFCGTINADRQPNDIRWVTQSKEYASLCKQTYQLAQSVVIPKLNQANGNLAIVMDLDETVLDNSKYQVERSELDLGFTQESWSKWVKRKEAGLIPGAKEFIGKIRPYPIRIIFISNRMDENLKPTQKNLLDLGVLSPKDLFLLRKNKSDTKEKRRAEVIEGSGRMSKVGPLKVIAYFGDAMGDFPKQTDKDFGETNFIFPNPMYGKW